MRQGWEIRKLGEVAYIGLGFTHTPEYVETGVPFLSVKDISSGEICWENVKFVSQEEYNSAPKGAKPQKGDIMFCRVGTMGKPVIVSTDTPFCTFVSLGYLHLLNNNISNVYVKYWMLSNAFDIQVKANVKGVAIKNLNTGWLREFVLPIPPFTEQEKIVAELDCLSGIIEKKKQQLKECDALAQSIFYEMFGNPIDNEKGWEVRKIGDVCVDKKAIKRANKHFNKEDKIQYIDIASINNKVNIIEETTPFVFEDAPSRAQQVVNYGDVLISLVRPNLKNIAIVQYTDSSLVASSGFCVLRTGEDVDRVFLKQVVLDDSFTTYLMDRVAGANYPAVREEDIKQCQIGIPPLALQQEFASKIEAIEKQKELIKQSIAETETLFNSRMEYYFN